jgi:RNA polymerase sigma-70 factor (ECF subfamily)
MEDRTAQDQRLVRAVLDGDQPAFAELVGRYQRMVAGVAWRYGATSDEIEDLVSEVFIKTYNQLGRYRPEHAFATWLYRLAANHVVDHGRRKRKERGRAEMPEDVADTSVGIEAAYESRQKVGRLRAAMGELAPHYRETMFLVYVEGLKVDEAARELGLPIGTVKTRLMRGREALRKTMETRHPGYFGGRP